MKKILLFLLLCQQGAYSQSFECDNTFETCGTPEQSGGGGGGGGSVLIDNTDLGDTYQNADDFDDDGIEDNEDNCPRIRNRDQSNSDGDMRGDACDNCMNFENDYQRDADGDNTGDLCDNDLDNDSIINFNDNCELIFNTNQNDVDLDKIGDACDSDVDGDGISNELDVCPFTLSETDDCNKDFDSDGILDYANEYSDNCVGEYNPDQIDTDSDGKGDECDEDNDNDKIFDNLDNCSFVSNFSQGDDDKDGLGNECDPVFCYVIYGNKDECLNPSLNLQVYSTSLLTRVNEEIPVRIFINRENQSFEYKISILNRPSGSKTRINNASGILNKSYNFEYQSDNRPTFETNKPGEYQLRLEIINPDVDLITGEINTQQTYDFRIVILDKNMTVQSCNSIKFSNIGLLVLVIAIMLFFQYKGNCHKR